MEAISRYQDAAKRVEQIEQALETLQAKKFAISEAQRINDIATLRGKLRAAINDKLSAIDSLTQMANLEKCELNYRLREFLAA